MTSDTSILFRLPSPRQVGQAPIGLLNENMAAVRSPIAMSWSGQASFVEYVSCLSPIMSTIIMPFERFDAISMESASLFSRFSLIINLSITIDISCFLFFSSLISSSTV